jgi:hypothetical protein
MIFYENLEHFGIKIANFINFYESMYAEFVKSQKTEKMSEFISASLQGRLGSASNKINDLRDPEILRS